MPRKGAAATPAQITTNSGYAVVLAHFANKRGVTRGEGKGFGSGALKANGRIFAMLSSRGQFVVKLPKERAAALVAAGEGVPFDPGHGRLMKEWIVVAAPAKHWVVLAEEACKFAGSTGKR